jgi:hypothetical protein
MKAKMIKTSLSILLALGLGELTLSASVPLYDNSTTFSGTYGLTREFGDQILLNTGGLPAATLDTMSFEYSLSSGSSGNEQATIRFYSNDGTSGKPGTKVFDSGAFNIAPANRGTLQLSGAGFNPTVNNNFTWTVSFTGIDNGESATLSLYGPPTVGNGYSDYWEWTGTDWSLKTISGVEDASFGATFTGTAVPEPSTLAWALTYGLVILGAIIWRRFKSA